MTISNLQRYSAAVWLAGAIVFALWCAMSLRADLARFSLAPLLQSWDLLLFTMVLTSVAYLLRAARWTWYLRRLGHPLSFGFSLMAYVAGFAFTLSPGKVGEVMRVQFYKNERIPLQDVAAAVFVERLMDILALTALGALVIGALPGYESAAWLAVGLVILGWGLASLMPRLMARISHARGTPPGHARQLLLAALTKAQSLLRADAVAIASLIGVFAWGLEGFGLLIVSGAMGPSLDAPTALGIYGASMLIGAISFLPGGLGSTEAVLTASLVGKGYPLAESILIALSFRLATLWFGVLSGWIAVIVLRRRLR